MSCLNFKIAPEVLGVFPEMRVSAIRIKGLKAALAPLGVYDAALLPSGGLALRCANPDQDQFNPLGATANDFPLHKELVVYAADNKVLCWGFNCRDSRDVCLSETTEEAVFFGEAAFAVQHEALRQALSRLQTLFSEKGAACGAIETASHETPSFSV